MTYLSSKKIYPGNWAEPLNGWYKNIDDNGSGVNDASKGWLPLAIVTSNSVVTFL
jgi:hypothetical protein